jgi:hypothetical protein
MKNSKTTDPYLGMGAKSFKVINRNTDSVPQSSIVKSSVLIRKRDYYKNLTDDEVKTLAKFVNVRCHSTFSMMDLRSYFMKLSNSRNK